MKFKNQIILSCVFISFFVFLNVSNLYAGPLRDLEDSPELGKISKASIDLTKPKWFIGNPNLEYIFQENDAIKIIGNYIGEGSTKFLYQDKMIKTKNKKYTKEGIIFYRANYLNMKREKLYVKVYIVHPKYKNNVELGLSDIINGISTPELKVFLEKRIDINGLPATLYAHKSGACSIVIKLPNEARLRTYKEKCPDVKELEEFTKSFDIGRLKLKLTPIKDMKHQ